MKRIREIQPIVQRILEETSAARDDDSLLYYMVCEDIAPQVAHLPFSVVMRNRAYYNIPCFETVRRTRQKLQAENVALRPSKRVAKMREEAEEDFREYALE